MSVSDYKTTYIAKTIEMTNLLLSLYIAFFCTLTRALPSSVESALEGRNAIIPDDGGSIVPVCWAQLQCSFHQIENMSLSARLSYVRYMENRFVPLHADNQFRAIEGVIEFFISEGMGGPGTWISYVDAGIVEAIQRGGAIALGIGTSTGGNPGSELWADFLTKMKNKEFKDRNVSLGRGLTS